MTPLEDRRFLFVTGKGGVGKTTVTAALATSLAARGRRVLVASCDAKERISALLGVEPLTENLRELKPGISGVKILPEVAMREYGQMILRSTVLYRAVFENRYTRGFFKGVPGLFEWVMLGKAWYHTTELLPDGSPRFHVVLFDAPATGHGLDMLRVPKVICDVVPPGILRRDAERAWTMFQDAETSGVVVCTLPEDMPTNETIELIDALRNELRLPVARLVINQVLEELFVPSERETLMTPRSLDPRRPGDEAVAVGIRRAIREGVQSASLARLAKVDVPSLRLPFLFDEATSPKAIEALSRLF